VDLDRVDFVGADALRRRRDEGITRTLVGLAFQDLAPLPKPGDTVFVGGEQAGTVTSADRGYALGRSLALAYMNPEAASASAAVEVKGETTWPATVTLEPFYDPKGERLRA
jgi:glycine cleavage system aminomethyltransferase T